MRVLSGIRAHGLSNQAVSDLCLMPYGHWDHVVNYCGLELNIVNYHLSLSVGDFVLVDYCVYIVVAYHMTWMWLSLFCDSLKISHLLLICSSISDYLYTVQHVCAMVYKCCLHVQAEEWFREGSKLLLTIARKSTTVKLPEEATQLLNEVEIFLKPGETRQDERIREISKLAVELYGKQTYCIQLLNR